MNKMEVSNVHHSRSERIVLRRRRAGLVETVPCTVRYLGPDDHAEAADFHGRIAEEIGDESLFSAENSISETLGGHGRALAFFDGDQMVCYRSVSYAPSEVEPAIRDLEIAGMDDRVAVMDFCVIDSAFRGNNLQQISYYLMESIVHADNKNILYTTVSPKNVYSLANVLDCGFCIEDLKRKYGGTLRFILAKRLDVPMAVVTRSHREVLLRDVRATHDILAEGCVGYKLRHRSRGMVILYGKPIA